MRRCVSMLFVVMWIAPSWATTEAYDYPFDDTWVATVVGTPAHYRAELPKKIPIKQRSITVFPEREVPEALWYQEKLRYSYALQRRQPAPLVFLVAGTGSSHDGAKIRIMARAFYQAGFHVISLSSPTHPNFVVAASSSAVPGHAVRDAEDLYRVMEAVWEKLKNKVEVTDFFVAGYSLGAFNAGFLAWLDEQRQVFNFKKALMINSPVRLYSSVSLLDRMIDNIPGGEDNFAAFYEKLVEAFTQVYKRADRLDFSEDFLYRAYETLRLENEQLAALIGVAFRLSAASLAFTADVMTDFGYVKPKNVHLTKNSSTREYIHVSHRLGFTDYVHEFFYPYYKAQDPSITREQFIEQMSLASIEDYLRTAEKIEVMHNEDDLILEPGEIDFFRRVFGERAKIYPKGGHCGNMEYRDNVAYMVKVLKE